MKKLYLFLILSMLCFSCSQKEDNETETEDNFFDFDFFDDEEEQEVIEEKVVRKPLDETPKLKTTAIEIDQLEEVPIEEEVVIEEENMEEADELEEVVAEEEMEEEDKLILIDYQEFRVRFKAKETFDVNEIDFEEKLKDKGLLRRYKTQQSYFDIYDIDKAINWSGAGDFAEFGQGFYERSKEVYSGKYVNFAKRKAFMFHTKISFEEDLNYSNIKKLKSDHEVENDHKVEAIVVFFGKGNYGYRYIYEIGNEHAELTSQTVITSYSIHYTKLYDFSRSTNSSPNTRNRLN